MLEGDTDNTTQIDSKIKTGPMDFGRKQTKWIRDVWMTYRTDGHMEFVFSTDEDTTTEVQRDTVTISEILQEEKIKVPRGLKGRYWTVELKNLLGADFDIDNWEVMVDITGKVR